MMLAFTTVGDLERALRDAAEAHHQYEQDTGRTDPNWENWYAEFMFGAE